MSEKINRKLQRTRLASDDEGSDEILAPLARHCAMHGGRGGGRGGRGAGTAAAPITLDDDAMRPPPAQHAKEPSGAPPLYPPSSKVAPGHALNFGCCCVPHVFVYDRFFSPTFCQKYPRTTLRY